jgi:DNA repair photolyase
MKGKNSGTREWATKAVNCCTGCFHDCRYCYAKSMAIRFKQVAAAQWPYERIREKDVFKIHKKYSGQVMFPSSHDITPTNLESCLTVLTNLLDAGNRILVVSKPHLECVKAVCENFKKHRNEILFRFSIGACDDRLLSYWEPNAPGYDERKQSLIYAYQARFRTSVSVEPMLDSANIDTLISDCLSYVSDAIWIGKMNHLGRFAKNANPVLQHEIEKIKMGQTDDIIRAIYDRHKTNPKIKWKAEIKKVIGIPLATAAGMDI